MKQNIAKADADIEGQKIADDLEAKEKEALEAQEAQEAEAEAEAEAEDAVTDESEVAPEAEESDETLVAQDDTEADLVNELLKEEE